MITKKEAKKISERLALIKKQIEEEHRGSIYAINELQTELLDFIYPIKRGYLRFRTSDGYVSFKSKKEGVQ